MHKLPTDYKYKRQLAKLVTLVNGFGKENMPDQKYFDLSSYIQGRFLHVEIIKENLQTIRDYCIDYNTISFYILLHQTNEGDTIRKKPELSLFPVMATSLRIIPLHSFSTIFFTPFPP